MSNKNTVKTMTVHKQIIYKESSEVDMIADLYMSRELATRLVEMGITMAKLKASN